LKIDFGGGIKSLADVRSVINSGAFMVCIGSMAVKNENEFDLALKTYGSEKISWLPMQLTNNLLFQDGKRQAIFLFLIFLSLWWPKELLRFFVPILTRMECLRGLQLSCMKRLWKVSVTLPYCKWGVSGIGDIEALEASSIPAVVFGKAFYEGRLSLKELKSIM
jgi:phosphoribosylformimino-5-aminoimidazole carboxamide ribotide isomerase